MSARARARVRARRTGLGQARVEVILPDRLVGLGLSGTLHTPTHDPECEIPRDNSGTVTVEADVGADGHHHFVRAQAEGGRIDLTVLRALADLVCGSWSSSPPQFPDGSECDMRADESIRLIVDFPVVARARVPPPR